MSIIPDPPTSDSASLLDLIQANDPTPPESVDKAWRRQLPIASVRWNQSFPFQLIVVEKTGDGSYAQKQAEGGWSWRFTLPIPPESMSIDMPFAIATHATLGGIVEEHNGAPFRLITLSGSTGVFFGRDQAPTVPDFSFKQAIFAGVLAQAADAKKAFGTFVNGTSFKSNVVPQTDFESPSTTGRLTGYFQFRLLQYFFEGYAALKKTIDGRAARLAFANHKDEAVYLVTPTDFQVRKAVPNVFEYQYSLQLKAWKRVRLSGGTAQITRMYVPIQRDPNKLAQALTTMENARRVLQSARATILAVGGDVQHSLFEPLRELCLFVKDALSVPLSVADLAESLIQATKSSVIELMGTFNAAKNIGGTMSKRKRQVSVDAKEAWDDIQALGAEQSDDPVTALSRSAHPGVSPFTNPHESFEFFSGINVGDLHLNPHLMAQIADSRTAVRKFSRLDFEQRRDSIAQTATTFANAMGMGHPTFNTIFGVKAPLLTALTQPTDEDYDIVYALNGVVMELNRLAVTNDNDPHPKLDTIRAMVGLAARSQIDFQVPRSKFAVPFPYGSTLEMLSFRYLQDPNRWHEIVVLNGLKTPFVDEEGFGLLLLTNGVDNNVTVNDASHLFVGQPVTLSSLTTARVSRRITKIDPLSPTLFLITLDGAADLGQFTTMAQAELHAFLPNTVNSQQTIFIPSNEAPIDQDLQTKAIAGVDVYDPLIGIGGVDLLLTSKDDLVVTPDGDSRWSVGLTNIIQQVRIALKTRMGTLNQHPEFGLPLDAGQSLADLSAADILRSAQTLFADNPTFAGISAVQIQVDGPVARLGLAVNLAGPSGQVIPVGIEVQR